MSDILALGMFFVMIHLSFVSSCSVNIFWNSVSFVRNKRRRLTGAEDREYVNMLRDLMNTSSKVS